MTTLYNIGIYGIIALGVAHSLMTFKKYKHNDENAYWFFSAGVALIVCGLLNYVYLHLADTHFLHQILGANILLFLFSIVLSMRFKKITMYLVFITSAILLISSILIR